MSFSIPQLYAVGTHYDVGFSMGSTFKARIDKYLDDFTQFKDKILPFIQTEDGKKILDNYLVNQKKYFPWYVDEIRGIADGASLPFEWIFSINLRVELLHLFDKDCIIINENNIECTDECSDFHLINENNYLIVHNEDASPSIYETAYLVTLKINSTSYDGRMSPNEHLTCYCYPGHLPGNAFGFNGKGFVFSVDALYPKYISVDRIPRQFISRAMFSANNLQEIEDILVNYPIDYGFCLNLSCCNKDLSIIKSDWNSEYKTTNSSDTNASSDVVYPISWVYELAPHLKDKAKTLVSKHCIVANDKSIDKNPNFYTLNYLPHFNHYNRIQIDECNVASSRHRQNRANQLPTPTNEKELFDIVSDTADKDYPIFREPSPGKKDTGKTIATGVYDMNKQLLSIYFTKPNSGSQPLIEISINCD